jgi:hypothetical protein
VLYRSAGEGFGFSQSSQSSDGIFVDVEGEGGKVMRVGLSKYWDATQSQGDVEDEGEGEGEGEEEDRPYCVIRGECLGHPKCYKKGTRFDGYCFIEARADAKGDVGDSWSDGTDWGLSGDEDAWRAKYGSPNYRHSESENESEGEGRRGRRRRGGKPRWKRKLCRESEGEEGIPSGPVLVSDWAVGEDHERLQSVFGWSF